MPCPRMAKADELGVAGGEEVADRGERLARARAQHAAMVKALEAAEDLANYCQGYFSKLGHTSASEGRRILAAYRAAREAGRRSRREAAKEQG